MSDVFTGPPDPQPVQVTFRERLRSSGDHAVYRADVRDESDSEPVTSICRIVGSATVWLDATAGAAALAEHINESWPPGHRLDAVGARHDLGGEFCIGGTVEAGPVVTESRLTRTA